MFHHVVTSTIVLLSRVAMKHMAAILDLTLRISRCDVTDLAARPPENKDVILHQYRVDFTLYCVMMGIELATETSSCFNLKEMCVCSSGQMWIFVETEGKFFCKYLIYFS